MLSTTFFSFTRRSSTARTALLFALAVFTSGLFTACNDEEDPIVPNYEAAGVVAKSSGNGLAIDLVTPNLESEVQSPALFTTDQLPAGPDGADIVTTDYYFNRFAGQTRARAENIYLGTVTGTDDFLYEGPLAPFIAFRRGTNVQLRDFTRIEGIAVSFGDNGATERDDNTVEIDDESETIIDNRSVRFAELDGGATVSVFPTNNRFDQTLAGVNFPEAGASVTFTVDAPSAGTYIVSFLTLIYNPRATSGIFAPIERDPLQLRINDVDVDLLDFAIPDSPINRARSISFNEVDLTAGKNTIEVIATGPSGAPINLLYVSQRN